jgi:hypothetical protein
MDHRQAKPRALANAFCRVEGFDCTGEGVFIHADSRIGERQCRHKADASWRSVRLGPRALAEITIEPPLGIASFAFIARLRIASSSWFASAAIFGTLSGTRVSIWTERPRELLQQVLHGQLEPEYWKAPARAA